MREIKFRGICISSGHWVYGVPIFHKEGGIASLLNEDAECIVQDKTVGQFTGLLDKNGKEIYEEDIVRFTSDGCLITQNIQWFSQKASFTPFFCYKEIGDIEVIGNTWENPNFFKEEHNNIEEMTKRSLMPKEKP